MSFYKIISFKEYIKSKIAHVLAYFGEFKSDEFKNLYCSVFLFIYLSRILSFKVLSIYFYNINFVYCSQTKINFVYTENGMWKRGYET